MENQLDISLPNLVGHSSRSGQNIERNKCLGSIAFRMKELKFNKERNEKT